MGAGMEVLVRDGHLVARIVSPIPALYRGFELHPDDPDDPYVFRIDMNRWGVGTGRIVFSRNAHAPAGSPATALHFDLTPMTAHRRPAATNPRPWAQAVGALTAAAAVTGLVRALHRR